MVAAHPKADINRSGGTIRAHTVDKTHYAGGQWYYGAYFSGKEGYWQHYRGPGGDGATSLFSGGIANWGWWGAFYHVLSVPKSFLLTHPFQGWVGNNYEATFISRFARK
jgi:hypothetical protein